MKNIIIAAICFLIGVSVVLGYRYMVAMKKKSVVSAVNSGIPEPTPQPTLALVPPSESVTGTLTFKEGTPQKLSRNENEFKDAADGAQILPGESVFTKGQSSAVASINGIVSAAMGPGAELVFANMFPANMVLQQKSGKITYTVTDTGHAVAVRALHTLISINSGIATVNVIDTDISVVLATGSAKLAIVDRNNETHVWKLLENQRVNIDDAARQAYFVLPRKGY